MSKKYSSERISYIAILIAIKRENTTKDILMLQDQDGKSVAHYLGQYSTWETNDPEILSLSNDNGETVEDILEEKKFKIITHPLIFIEK